MFYNQIQKFQRFSKFLLLLITSSIYVEKSVNTNVSAISHCHLRNCDDCGISYYVSHKVHVSYRVSNRTWQYCVDCVISPKCPIWVKGQVWYESLVDTE